MYFLNFSDFAHQAYHNLCLSDKRIVMFFNIYIMRMAIKSYKNMDSLLKFAENFVLLTKEAKRGRKPKRTRNRKDIKKDLERARKAYSESKDNVSSLSREIKKLTAKLEQCTNDMNEARDSVMNYHDYLRNMDISGAGEIHGDNNDVSYVIDKKKFDISFAEDGTYELIPAGKKKEKETEHKLGLADDSKSDESTDENNSDDINWIEDFEHIFN